MRDAWPARHSGTRLRAERRDRLRRAAPRDYQAQSHFASSAFRDEKGDRDSRPRAGGQEDGRPDTPTAADSISIPRANVLHQGPHPSASPRGVRDAWPAQHSGTRPQAERRDGLRRAAPRDYQAQSHLSRWFAPGQLEAGNLTEAATSGSMFRRGCGSPESAVLVFRRRAASAVTASGREGCLASPTQGTRFTPSGGIGSAGRPRGTTRRSPNSLRSSAVRGPDDEFRARKMTGQRSGKGPAQTVLVSPARAASNSASPRGVRDAWPAQHQGLGFGRAAGFGSPPGGPTGLPGAVPPPAGEASKLRNTA